MLGTEPSALERLSKCSLLSHIPTLTIRSNHYTFIYLLCMCVFVSVQMLICVCVPIYMCV